jgi:cell division protein FtsL
MNTAIRVLTAGYITPNFKPIKLSIGCSTLILLAMLVFSALSLVYVKDLHRRLFIKYQEIEALKETNLTQKGKLLLEKSAWSVETRIQHIAQRKLAMSVPSVIKRVDLDA